MSDKYTAEQARVALDSLDDYARMSFGVDAIGPRKVLESFIEQAAQMMREREVGGQGEAVAWVNPEAIAHLSRMNGVAFVHVWNCSDGDNRVPLFTARRAAVPDGFVLVPVEPTEEMIDAAMQREDDEPLSSWGKSVPAPHSAIYRAMLAAAPEVTK